MSAWLLYCTFFKVGFFTIGGGLAALPLLQKYLVDGGWIAQEMFVDMIAVSQSTPGPIGINMATYAGYESMGVPGAVIATVGMVSPSLLIILLIARFMRDFNDHPWVKHTMAGLRPAAVGMIAAAVWFVLGKSLFDLQVFPTGRWLDFRALLLFGVLALLYARWRLHPIVYILLGGTVGCFLF